MIEYSFSFEYVAEYLRQFEMRKSNIISFNGVIREKVLTKSMCEKAAASGLTLKHLKSAHERNGFDGIYSILSEKNCEGKHRVTKQKAVAQRLYNYFTN